MQEDANGTERPVCMISRCLSDTEMKYAPIEGEALALVWAVDRLQYLLEGHQTIVRTDHKPLIYIFKNSEGKSKLTRWALKLQQMDLFVEYVPGKANIVADHASRVPIGDLSGLLDEAAFDLAETIPPTSHIYSALEDWREHYDRQLEAKRCPVCHRAESYETMMLCDMCNDAYHLSCAGIGTEPRYWYC